jgi:hypothetical protein
MMMWVRDLSDPGERASNFAIMHRGGVIRDDFATQAIAWLYVQLRD